MVLPGEMSDCTNVIINRGDVLSKRKGIIRAFDEQFEGPVCGLFSYTDGCGQEFVLVADTEGIKIRTPFLLPVFTVADCYPSDGFDGDDGDAINVDDWRNTGGYEIQDNALVQVAVAVADDDSDEAALNGALRWFKDACSTRYEVLTQYKFSDPCLGKQKHIIVLRGSGDLSTGAVLYATLEFCTSPVIYRLKIFHRKGGGQINEIQSQTGIAGNPSGFFKFGYDSTTRRASVLLTVGGGASVSLVSSLLTTIDDLDLGLVSAIGISFTTGGTPSNDNSVLNVSGGSLA
jgi:hypothetical protein